MNLKELTQILVNALDDMKALDIQVIDVSDISSFTDNLIIASGRSDRQVKALAEKIIETAKNNGVVPLGVEGKEQGEWVLVDMGDVIAHLMHPTARAYYQLEKLWGTEEHKILP